MNLSICIVRRSMDSFRLHRGVSGSGGISATWGRAGQTPVPPGRRTQRREGRGGSGGRRSQFSGKIKLKDFMRNHVTVE